MYNIRSSDLDETISEKSSIYSQDLIDVGVQMDTKILFSKMKKVIY